VAPGPSEAPRHGEAGPHQPLGPVELQEPEPMSVRCVCPSVCLVCATHLGKPGRSEVIAPYHGRGAVGADAQRREGPVFYERGNAVNASPGRLR